mmetsp:Transcript_13726/g.13655  ORF Transcript_13726/g.13655 Transcript_13726/m.13655 type:complete len:89 (+) Transcript_13726:1-267(+)
MTNPPKEAILPIPETDDLQEHESSAMQSMARVQEDEKVGHDSPKEELTEDGTGQRHGAFETGSDGQAPLAEPRAEDSHHGDMSNSDFW